MGGVAAKAGKAIAAGLAAGATAVSVLAKQSLDSYADYEQLVGGVETLFGAGGKSVEEYAASVGKSVDEVRRTYNDLITAQEAVMEDAANAYKTAGMSANEYMETVTSFAASLTSSLGGDTMAAAEYARIAVTDMADNANKMGSNMESIQNAYQGFAKQNYTMLDNLKLGYGGTAQEMYRLLSDAKKIDETFDAVFSIDTKGHLEAGYADIVEAIHIVQTEMGITGTTAAEAEKTISGSIASTKAAWKNLLTGFADDEADLELLIGNLVESATTAVRNVVPRIAQILSGISQAMTQIMPIVSAELPAILSELLPGVINGAVALINGLVAALPSLLGILIAQLPSIFTQISNGLIQTFPVLLETAKNLFGQLFDYISLELLNTGYSFQEFSEKAQNVFEQAWSVLETVWETIGQPVFDLIMSMVNSVRETFAEYMPEIQEFVSQCFEDISDLWENHLKPCLEAIGDFLESIFAPIFEFVFGSVISGIVDNAFNGIKSLWNNFLKPVLVGITDFLTGVFTLDFGKAFSGIVSIVKGIFGGIADVVKAPLNAVISLVNGFIKGLNKLKIPDWVPGFGGNGINIPLIPRLEKGGILKKGQVGLLEGSGAEAVVPLDQNRAWISAVAADMSAAVGGDKQKAQKIIDLLERLIDMLPDTMADAFTRMKFDVNNREFARLVKAVN